MCAVFNVITANARVSFCFANTTHRRIANMVYFNQTMTHNFIYRFVDHPCNNNKTYLLIIFDQMNLCLALSVESTLIRFAPFLLFMTWLVGFIMPNFIDSQISYFLHSIKVGTALNWLWFKSMPTFMKRREYIIYQM